MQLDSGSVKKRGSGQAATNGDPYAGYGAYSPSTSGWEQSGDWGSWGAAYGQQGAYGDQTGQQGPYAQHQGAYNPYGGQQQPPDWGYGQQQDTQQAAFPAFGAFQDTMMANPAMMNAAAAAGQQFANQQKERIAQYVSVTRLKYYFAVDNAYVGRKLGLLLFPWAQTQWSVGCESEDGEPVPPRADVNAPDLYIPAMAIITYVLLCGFVLGTQGRFSPESLGATSSNALGWLVIENLIVLFSKYVLAISSALSFWHTLAYSSYKFTGMIVSLVAFVVGGKTAYYCTLAYCAAAIAFFLMRTVKGFVLDGPWGMGGQDGTKRKLYLLLFISLTQPFVMWWLTSAVTNYDVSGPEDMDSFIREWQASGGKVKEPSGMGGMGQAQFQPPPPPQGHQPQAHQLPPQGQQLPPQGQQLPPQPPQLPPQGQQLPPQAQQLPPQGQQPPVPPQQQQFPVLP